MPQVPIQLMFDFDRTMHTLLFIGNNIVSKWYNRQLCSGPKFAQIMLFLAILE